MKIWVSHICVFKWSLQYLANLLKKKYLKIGGTWCYYEFKGPILLITDLKKEIFFFLRARVSKQVISKGSGYGIYIQLAFYIETS